jgi:hypothetical protein
MRPGIIGDLRLRLGERFRFRQIERQRRDAQRHDMPMRVEQAGQQRPVLAIEPPVGAPVLVVRGFLALLDQPPDLAIGGHGHAGEADDLPFFIEGDAVDVIDKAVGEGGGAERKEERGKTDSPKVTKVSRCHRKMPVKRGDTATNGGGGKLVLSVMRKRWQIGGV